MEEKKFIHALDLSLNSTGICIFSNDGIYINMITVDTKKQPETKMKLRMIGEKFAKLIKYYPVDTVVIEQGFSRFSASTQQVFKVHGIAGYLYSDFEQIYYPATVVKKTITGKGNANKEEVQTYLHRLYPHIIFPNMDVSDAFAVGITFFVKTGILKI